MRHIPEEELHAYLDQALSRSQCVEIESHLAECPGCQAARNDIAALRDRTTALLTKLAPRWTPPPPFDAIRHRAAIKRSVRHRRRHAGAWAASVVAAIGLGWVAGAVFNSGSDTTGPAPTAAPAVATVTTPVVAPPVVQPAVPDSMRRTRPRPSRQPSRQPSRHMSAQLVTTTPAPALKPPAVELSALDSVRSESDLVLEGVWRTVSWDGARAETGGEAVPHIDGLPVVQVQVQASEQGKRPLLVVAQQLTSGEVIRTIEGPASDVSRLLGRRVMTDPEPADSLHLTDRRGFDHTMAMQRGDRMLAITGKLPSDSLRAMIRRLNAELRSR